MVLKFRDGSDIRHSEYPGPVPSWMPDIINPPNTGYLAGYRATQDTKTHRDSNGEELKRAILKMIHKNTFYTLE